MTSFELETVNYNVCCRCLAGVVSMLKQTELSGDVFDMVVRREDEFLLKDTLKRMSKLSFKPSSRIIVRSLDVWCDIRYYIILCGCICA